MTHGFLDPSAFRRSKVPFPRVDLEFLTSRTRPQVKLADAQIADVLAIRASARGALVVQTLHHLCRATLVAPVWGGACCTSTLHCIDHKIMTD